MNALHQLQNDPNIIIKHADKGGTAVVLNKHDYNDKVLHILSDKTFYRQKTHSHTTSILHEVQSLINQLHTKRNNWRQDLRHFSIKKHEDSSILRITKNTQTCVRQCLRRFSYSLMRKITPWRIYFYEYGTPYYQIYLQILQNFNRVSRHQHSHCRIVNCSPKNTPNPLTPFLCSISRRRDCLFSNLPSYNRSHKLSRQMRKTVLCR